MGRITDKGRFRFRFRFISHVGLGDVYKRQVYNRRREAADPLRDSSRGVAASRRPVSLRTSSRDSARAPARGGQTTTADRNGVRSSADQSPQKGDSHLQTRDTQPKWLEASE